MTSAYDVLTFEDFWPHYVRMHTRPETHALHALGTLSAAAFVALALARKQPLFLLAAPLCDYALAQASHRIFEGNVTSPWKNQVWHTRAELRMLRLVMTGRMRAEVTKCASLATREASSDTR